VHAIKQNKISELRKVDADLTKEKIMMLVTRCSQLVNVQNNLNALQIEFCAEQIMSRMWMYSLEEVQVVLDSGASGKYGTIFNRIDPATILEWFPKYDAERQVVVDAINENEKLQQNIYDIFNHPAMKAALEKTVAEMPTVEIKVDKIERKPSSFEQLIIDEFAALAEWQDDIRFKVYNDRPYLFSDYRKERYQEAINEQNEY
jgi:hypothetical protein